MGECGHGGGVLHLMGCLQGLVPHKGTWTKKRSARGLEHGAHAPRTMGETAKGPVGMAGFLKEKSQNELLRGRLALDALTSLYLCPNLYIKQKLIPGASEGGESRRDPGQLASPTGNFSILPFLSALPAGAPAWLWQGAGREEQGSNTETCDGQRTGDLSDTPRDRD